MKRDMELIRKILIYIQDNHDGGYETLKIPTSEGSLPFLEGYNFNTLIYHLDLLFNAGLVKKLGDDEAALGLFEIEGLTWQGHEFLDAIRDETVWKKTQEVAQTAGVGTLTAIKDIAVQVAVSFATKILGG
jgi:hypothetical protein